MYTKSFIFVLLCLFLVGILTAGAQWVGKLPGVSSEPSVYDPKITVEQAMQTAKTPLLIEFYTDPCETCRVITPWVAALKPEFKDKLTFVMVNVDDTMQEQVVQLFGVSYVPALFVFDFHHMAKAQVKPIAYGSKQQLQNGIEQALNEVKNKVAARSA